MFNAIQDCILESGEVTPKDLHSPGKQRVEENTFLALRSCFVSISWFLLLILGILILLWWQYYLMVTWQCYYLW